jgi:hypothetical protein
MYDGCFIVFGSARDFDCRECVYQSARQKISPLLGLTMTQIITPDRLIEMAWQLPLPICELRKELMPDDFLHRCTELAEKAGIAVFQINFNDYSDAVEALSATENQDFVSAVEKPAGRTLLIFENADCLAPLDCNITYSLRSILTTNLDGNTVSLFHATSTAITQLFHSAFEIC